MCMDGLYELSINISIDLKAGTWARVISHWFNRREAVIFAKILARATVSLSQKHYWMEINQ